MIAPLPHIVTANLVLVPVRAEDEAEMLALERVLEGEKSAELHRSEEFYRTRLMTWVREANPAIPSGMWKIVVSGLLVGRAGIDWSERSQCLELSYALVPDARHRGHATTAVKALVGWAFENGDASEILAVVRASNRASIAVMQRANLVPHSQIDGHNLVFAATRPAPTASA